MNINLILTVISILWLAILSIVFYINYLKVKNLLIDGKKGDFLKIFKNIEVIQDSNSKAIQLITKDIANFKEFSKLNIRNVGLVKFNPFGDAGGDHSFSLALLNDLKSGIIISSLHTRERTRVYLKEVSLGKTNLKLSKEESQALEKALKQI